MSYVASPINYTGTKYRLLPFILPRLPHASCFYDVFCGGAVVGLNASADKVIAVDCLTPVVELYRHLQRHSFEQVYTHLHVLIGEYGLSDTKTHGYAYYHADSNKGLGSINKHAFEGLRADYNRTPDPVRFLLLLIFSFNNQHRFNQSGAFNMPVGKRDFNHNMVKKLQAFMHALHTKDITFCHQNWHTLNLDELVKANAFIYLDPPYLLGQATYNQAWTAKDDALLRDFLLVCHRLNLKFALSNVTSHLGQTHDALVSWVQEHGFVCHHQPHHYRQATKQKSGSQSVSDEVLICNF